MAVHELRVALTAEDYDRTLAFYRDGGPIVTPWAHHNMRLHDPDGMRLTLFTVLEAT